MELDPGTGKVTYDKDELRSIQAILTEMRDEAQKRGNHQEASNYKEIAGHLRLKLAQTKGRQ